MANPWCWIGAGALVIVLGALGLPYWRRWRKQQSLMRAMLQFRQQREHLEAKFLQHASQRGKPRGLLWSECEWMDAVQFARDRQSGTLTAFVGITVKFAAVQGGEMEDVAAVDDPKEAVAVFYYCHHRWVTEGQALFNLNPTDALAQLSRQFEPTC
ncbi:MAG: hypothetical protein KatS3mg113_0353 [Planctomycetaceae bacterium]|nr:MAG: hypothetical protein KatS3mg113_0353 [Planctomycetaceae bacterium]